MKISTINKFGFEFPLYESDDVNDWLDMFYHGKYKGEDICWDDLKDGTRMYHLFDNTILIKEFYNYSVLYNGERAHRGYSICLSNEGEDVLNEDTGKMEKKGRWLGDVHPEDAEEMLNIFRMIKLKSIL